MNDTANARRFINSYNKIDSKMRALYNFKPSQSFSDMVTRRKIPSYANSKTN